MRTRAWLTLTAVVLLAAPASAAQRLPNILLVSVDTLRADRMSAYGYERPTSPFLDSLMADGVRFADARTIEPLTAPALTSMLTGLDPHEHGATRNGVGMRSSLPSLPKLLKRRGYLTTAVVANWTLRDKLSGLGEHFDNYIEVLEEKRWLFWAAESSADDVNDRAGDWLAGYAKDQSRPFFLWAHYVEPHGPYEHWPQFADRLGTGDSRSRSDRYDMEVAYVDDRIGRMIGDLQQLDLARELLVVFVADHGESLGEHGYWGHGRHVYDATLEIPMAITWPGRIVPGVVEQPALNTDLPATILGLLDIDSGGLIAGWDWSSVLSGDSEPSAPDRVTWFQSHRGAVKNDENREKVRQNGLLEVARIEGGKKEMVRVTSGVRRVFDLAADPDEESSLVASESAISEELSGWLQEVRAGLQRSDELPPPSLEDKDLEQLEALGYLND